MTALAPTFGPAQDVRVFAGSDLAIEIIFEDADENPIDLTGRVFAMVAFDASTEEPVLSRSATATGTSCLLAFVGDETRELRETSCSRVLRIQTMEVTSTGTDVLTDGTLSVVAAPSGINAAPATSSSAQPVQILRTGDRRQVVFRYQGAPGQSPWAAANQTLAQYNQQRATEAAAIVPAVRTDTDDQGLDAEEQANARTNIAAAAAAELAAAQARVAELEEIEAIRALLYPISLLTANGNPIAADGNPLAAGV